MKAFIALLILSLSNMSMSANNTIPDFIKLPRGASYKMFEMLKEKDGTLKKTGVLSPETIDQVIGSDSFVDIFWLEQTSLPKDQFENFKKKIVFYLNYAAGGQLVLQNPQAKGLKVSVNIILLSEIPEDRYEKIMELKDQFSAHNVDFAVVKAWKKPN